MHARAAPHQKLETQHEDLLAYAAAFQRQRAMGGPLAFDLSATPAVTQAEIRDSQGGRE